MDISLMDFSSSCKWLVLFFYPLDFGYITPSELLELEARREELEMMDCKILAVSSDSVVVHEQFASTNPGFGGVHGIKFPLLEDKNGNISRMYGVKKEGAGHSFRAYFIIDSDLVVRARVVGDLPVALGMDEMVRQVKALKLAVTGIFVDGEGNQIGDAKTQYKVADKKESKGGLSMFRSNSGYYNTEILRSKDFSATTSGKMQSPVDIITSKVVTEKQLGPIIFKYTSVWSSSLLETPDTPQPTVVTNTGISWEVKVPEHHQQMIYGGPLMSRNYRLDHYLCHWGGSEHMLDGQEMDGELHLVHYHIKYKDYAEAIMHENAVAVVAIMLKVGEENINQEVEKIGEILPQIKYKGQSAQTAEQVDMMKILPGEKDYVTYVGSLTTPGFQENVMWMVMSEPIVVSKQAINRMKELQYGGEHSYKMINNTRKVANLEEREGFKPAKN